MNAETLHILPNKDSVKRYKKGILIEFCGARRVLSTSMLNGGLKDDLTAVFNYNCLADFYECSLTEKTYEEELSKNASYLGLNPFTTTGISTAAWMECVAICEKSYQDLVVTAIVTGGIDNNAVCVADPASYYEKDNEFFPHSPGTINILLSINCNLVPGAIVRALTTCTQAKVKAVRQLLLGSCYSNELATGSGTDGTIIFCDTTSKQTLTDTGEHSKLGELIGTSVFCAVQEALQKQTGACPARQHTLFERGKRFHITIGSLWTAYETYYKTAAPNLTLSQFETKFEQCKHESHLVVFSSLYFHMLDQYRWNLLEWAEVLREAKSLCHWYLTTPPINSDITFLDEFELSNQTFQDDLLQLFQRTILTRVLFVS